MNIILGSQSKGRQQVLKDAGYAFQVLHANIDEKAIRSDDYEELPLLVALAKTEALLPLIKESSLLITADQVVVCDTELREKPESLAQAREYLRSYSENSAKTHTGLVVTNTKTGKQASGTDTAQIFFKKIPDEVVERILRESDVLNAAGGFIIQDPLLEPYIDHYIGALDSIIGLPMKLLNSCMDQVLELL